MAKSNYQPPKKVHPDHQDVLKNIGDKLKATRKKKDITIKQMSEDLKISRNSIPKMENGEIYYNILTLLRVLEYLNIDPVKVLGKE